MIFLIDVFLPCLISLWQPFPNINNGRCVQTSGSVKNDRLLQNGGETGRCERRIETSSLSCFSTFIYVIKVQHVVLDVFMMVSDYENAESID